MPAQEGLKTEGLGFKTWLEEDKCAQPGRETAAERSCEPKCRWRVRGNCRWGLLGGKETCDAKVRQMVADNEDVEMQGGGEAGWTPAGLSTENTQRTVGKKV